MKAKKRHTFKCWHCGKIYALKPAITEAQKWIVACPYCQREAVVQLSAFAQKKTVFRGGEAESQEYDLPEVVPTEAREE